MRDDKKGGAMRRTLMLVGCLCLLVSATFPQIASAKTKKTKTLLHENGKVIYAGESVIEDATLTADVDGAAVSCSAQGSWFVAAPNSKATLLEGVLPGCADLEPRLAQLRIKKGKKGVFSGVFAGLPQIVAPGGCSYNNPFGSPVSETVTATATSIAVSAFFNLPQATGPTTCETIESLEEKIAIPGVGA
jgi:hypothetical protein